MSAAPLDLSPELSFYRDRTRALLRRYERLAIEVGRMPSLLGREFFRARVTSYRPCSFEDAVLFVHDIERCLQRLDITSRFLLARIALEDYSELEIGSMLHMSERRVRDRYHDALDALSREFLRRGILNPERDAAAPRGHSRITFRPPRRRRVRRIEACAAASPDEAALVNSAECIVFAQAPEVKANIVL